MKREESLRRLRLYGEWQGTSDVLSALCTLSLTGQWNIDEQGRQVYTALPPDGQIATFSFVDEYTHGHGIALLPTMVAMYWETGCETACKVTSLPTELQTKKIHLRIPNLFGTGIKIEKSTLSHLAGRDGIIPWHALADICGEDDGNGLLEQCEVIADILEMRLGDPMS